MDYGRILTRAWEIVWNNKFLILLGILVALGSGIGGGPNGGGGGGGYGAPPSGPGITPTPGPEQQWPSGPPEIPPIPFVPGWVLALGLGVMIVVIGILLVIGITLWVVGRIADGGLIAGVGAIDGGGTSSFTQAWSAGWHKGWRLIGIGLLPVVPGLIAAALILATVFSMTGGVEQAFSSDTMWQMIITVAAIICPAALIGLALTILRTFADRACVLEDKGIGASYGRGWEILRGHLGPAVVLFLLQIAIAIVLGLMLFFPSIALSCCCILWPILLVIRGTIETYFSTLWTLAWREWAGGEPVGSFTVEKAPAA